MSAAFKAGDFEGGLMTEVQEVSALLDKHFPSAHDKPNPNELPDAPLLG